MTLLLRPLTAIPVSPQLIPQIAINYRRHNTTGLQPTMMLLWASAGVPLGVYNITENFNIALRIQPQILTFLSLLTWAQCKYYDAKWPRRKIASVAIPIAAVMAGIQIGLIFALRKALARNIHWPVTVMAILSACLLCLGVLRHYVDIWRERTVRGISFHFVALDALGDLTSLLSVFFEPQLDILGIVIYASELALWTGVFACGGYFNFRPWLKRKRSTYHARSDQGAVASSRTNANDSAVSTGVVDAISTRSGQSSRSVFRTASQHGDETQATELDVSLPS